MHCLHVGDIAAYCQQYTGPLFHAALMDAPYHLTSITERFGKDDSAPAQHGTDGAFQRASRGFMGKTWDGGDVAYRVDTWQAIKRVLHPGAFMFVFGGSRTFHRMAVAIEDAGFVIHPALVWLFGSGFPKATRIDTQVDRDNGAEREAIGLHPNPGSTSPRLAMGDGWQPSPQLTAPATPLAQQWAGHRYGLQALKPAAEFIICAQVPYNTRPVDSITGTGAGALNIDDSRIESGGTHGSAKSAGLGSKRVASGVPFVGGIIQPPHPAGRWPAHVALSHTPTCTPDACADGCAVKALAEQSGESVSSGGTGETTQSIGGRGSYNGGDSRGWFHHGDSGTAARFFHNSDYLLERLEGAPPFFYCGKADRWQREAGLALPENETPGVYAGRANGSLGQKTAPRRNGHPTVKPLALLHWLATLLLPPDAYAPRRLLVPFSGSGSEMIGARLAGWEHVQGVELETPYAAIAWQRLEFWQQFAPEDWHTARELAEIWEDNEKARHEREAAGQLPLFDLEVAR